MTIKTEILIVNPKQLVCPIDNNSLRIGNEYIKYSDRASNLDVTLNNNLSMDDHINNVCKSVYFEIRRMKHMSILAASPRRRGITVASRLCLCIFNKIG